MDNVVLVECNSVCLIVKKNTQRKLCYVPTESYMTLVHMNDLSSLIFILLGQRKTFGFNCLLSNTFSGVPAIFEYIFSFLDH